MLFLILIDLFANLEKINDNSLKIKWKSLNNFGYVISLYKISLSINESKFREIEDSSAKLSIFNQMSKNKLFFFNYKVANFLRINFINMKLLYNSRNL